MPFGLLGIISENWKSIFVLLQAFSMHIVNTCKSIPLTSLQAAAWKLRYVKDKRSSWHPAALQEEQKWPFDLISTRFPQMRNSTEGPWQWVGARRVLGTGRAGAHGRAMVPAPRGFAAAVLPHAPSPPRLRRSHASSLFAWEDN